MLQSKLFGKTQKFSSREDISINEYFLQKAGFITKTAAGIYSFLPLGFRVLKKIEGVIRKEMEKIGGQEILMPALHPKEYWKKTGRWETMDDLYKLRVNNKEFALGPTHEEIVVPLAKNFIQTYKDLPLYLFQIQTKFRKEKRAKSGLLRQREFIMKDLYSFHENEKDLDVYYEIVKKSYFEIFKKIGIKNYTYLTYASGGSFSKYSHEFQVITKAGEDTIFICEKCKIAINKEIINETFACPICGNKNLKQEKAIEIGNIFKLKTKFSEPFQLYFTDKNGEKKLVQMGCYGIGLGRLMGTIVELFHDEAGILWPKIVAPFDVHLIPIGTQKNIDKTAKKLYDTLKKEKIEVLYDDRKNKSVGEILKDCDLIGIPIRIIVSEKTLKENSVELKERNKKVKKLIRISNLIKILKNLLIL
ncbi:MAG: aminoacyl--tRNA ligase-related protein [Minisyncoccia bacterium]